MMMYMMDVIRKQMMLLKHLSPDHSQVVHDAAPRSRPSILARQKDPTSYYFENKKSTFFAGFHATERGWFQLRLEFELWRNCTHVERGLYHQIRISGKNQGCF